MVDTAGYLSKNCNQFLSLELERSSDLKREIVSDFRTSIVTILVVSVVIIALAVILSIAITRRRSVSVRLAVYQNACRKNADRIMKNAEKSLLDSKAGNSNMELYTKQLEETVARFKLS